MENMADGLGKMAKREKYWDELDTEGKIERIRQEVKALKRKSIAHSSRLEELEAAFEYHAHVGNEIMVKSRRGLCLPEIPYRDQLMTEEKYF